VLESGAAFDTFKSVIAAQGGDTRVLDDTNRFSSAPVIRQVTAKHSGYIARIPARAIGDCVVRLGGGRTVKTDAIDHRVGIETHVHVGDSVTAGDVLFTVHAAMDAAATDAEHVLTNIVVISDVPTDVPAIVHEIRS
jgi:pyrimidine-nucleoside phosphorylase